MNSWYITGRVSKEPEIKEIKIKDQTKKVARFSVAVPRKFDKENVDFVEASVWGNKVDYVEKHIHKGDGILLFGTPSINQYQTKTGETKAQLQITVDEMERTSFSMKDDEGKQSKPESPKEEVAPQTENKETPLIPVNTDDLPF